MSRAQLSRMGPAAVVLAMAAPGAAGAADLAVHPPAGFTVHQSSPDGDPVKGYEVTSTADPDAGCQITFHPAAAPQARRPAGTDAAAARSRRDAIARRFAEAFDVKAISPLALQGVDGVLVSADPKSGEGRMHALLTVFDTSRGEVEIDCVAFDETFPRMRPRFEAIIRGVTLPK